MVIETVFHISLALAALLTALVTGFVLLFAIVVMPGLGTLDDRGFLRAFQATDRVIQDNQPLFIFVWVGSALFLLLAAVLGFTHLAGVARILLVVAAASYLLGAQLPTLAVNIPLNNRLQTLDIEALDEPTRGAERRRFEARWNRWNALRTVFAGVASVLLIVVLWLA